MLMRATSGPDAGDFEVYDISHNMITSAASMGAVGLEWTVAGFGDFSDNAGETDMLMRNSNTGAFEVYDISHNAITSAAAMGAVGLEWQVAGFGDFSGNAGETDMLMRNSSTGAFEVYDIGNNAVTSAAMGSVNLEWTVPALPPIRQPSAPQTLRPPNSRR
jgi:Holliday junction resolvase-like predicted endonuclease